ncbi:hypothetical protein BDR06DRAFT_972651 [Suillus hirtellus]|nr:hypothetical protein BDR06DRAFT_972651 [Suillus hirtellus]
MSVYRLVSWMNLGSLQKSEDEIQCLVKDILQADDFNVKHLEGFLVKKSLQKLDKDEGGDRVTFPDDWVETHVTINILTKSREEGPKLYIIPSFHYHPLIEVIHAAFVNVQANTFHFLPFKCLWKDALDDHQK